MEKRGYAVFLGRFQPIHNTRLAIIKQALAESEKLVVVVGSARATPDVKNPFTYAQRVAMIEACLDADEVKRTTFYPVRDYFYNDNMWLTEVQQAVARAAGDDPSVCLYGAYKDASSYYVQLFPQWEFRVLDVRSADNATDVRSRLFDEPYPQVGWQDGVIPWHTNVPKQAAEWIKLNFLGTDLYASLKKDHEFFKAYKAKWESAPFPPIFVTTDAVVIVSGHVLVVQRGRDPGKGLVALPGGFLRNDERIEDGMLRELREETRIKVPKERLKQCIVGSRTFDYPGRSLRGRTITHAFHVDLGTGELPEIKAGDDASHAFWMPLADAMQGEGKFFEDHWHIIYNMVQSRR